MMQLAMILLGTDAFRRRWWFLPVVGGLWIGLGIWLIFDASDRVLFFTVEALGLVLVLQGLATLLSVQGKSAQVRYLYYLRSVALLILGVMVAMPLAVDHGIPDRLLFGTAFFLDGILRAASAWVVRFNNWGLALAAGLAEMFVSIAVATNWPLHHDYTVPMSLGVILIASGWSSIALGRQIRRLPRDASITSLRRHASQNRYRPADSLPGQEGRSSYHSVPMTLYVWTPIGSSNEPRRRPIVDRYIAAVDAQGVIATGHSALERLPDVYISHYPAVEIDHSPEDFTTLLRAGSQNDIPGKWQPDHAFEVSQWCEADQTVSFHRYNAPALIRFWERYRVDATYNLTRRSCSTVTSLAIESALEGSLASQKPSLKLLKLLSDPNFWAAAMLRRRGTTMAWTPGLVLDYARLLRAIVEQHTDIPDDVSPSDIHAEAG